MKHLSKLDVDDMQIIGIDPGMRDLIHAVDLDHMLNRAKSVTYTSAQRRSERASSQFARCMQNEKSELIKGAEQELSQYNSRSNYRYKLMDFSTSDMYTWKLLSHFMNVADTAPVVGGLSKRINRVFQISLTKLKA